MLSKGKSRKKVFIIGIDGGTFNVIMPMIDDNRLPNLAGLIKKGQYGNLLSTIPPVTAPAWSSFITGTNPGRHGVFSFFNQDINNYKIKDSRTLMNLRHMRGIPFWRVLNKHKYKVGLINVPLTYPPDKVDRFMISGMLVPQMSTDYTYPPELSSQLDNYSVDLDDLMVHNKWQGKAFIKKNRERFIQNVFNLSRTRAFNSLKLMKREEWDLFMVVFTGSDRICHFFWEESGDGTSPSSMVRDYYTFLDGLIGELIEEAGKDTVKVVMSDHGFGSAPTKSINVFALMRQLGYTALIPANKFSYIRKRLFEGKGIKRKIAYEDMFDWKRSKIFPVPMYANFLGICINTENEKRWGVVSSEDEYDSLRKEVICKLQDLIDPNSGEKLVASVHAREAIYSGSFMSEAPDIIVQFRYDYKINLKRMQKRLVRKVKDRMRTGDHRREGIFIVSGPEIEVGYLEREIFIQDITTTLLYLFDVPVPDTYDGSLIQELFSKEYLEKNPLQHEEMNKLLGLDAHAPNGRSQDDFEKSKELLQNLGYL